MGGQVKRTVVWHVVFGCQQRSLMDMWQPKKVPKLSEAITGAAGHLLECLQI